MSLVSSSSFKLSLSQEQVRNFPIRPIIGLIATISGTLLAVLLIPENPYPEGALILAALAMTCGLIAAPLLAAFRKPRSIVRAECLLAIAPVYWLLMDLLQGAYPLEGVSEDGIKGAFWMIGLFVCGVWGAAITHPWRPPAIVARAASYSIEPKTLFRLILIFFLMGIMRFAYPADFNPIVMLNGLTGNRWSAPWSRGQLGGWDAFLDHMSYFGYLLPTLTVLLAQKTKWLDRRVLVSAGLSLLITAFLAQGGGRRIIGVVIGSAIICWVLQQKKINVRKLVVVLLSTAMLLLTMQLMLEYRNEGWGAALRDEERQLQYQYLHVDDNFLRLSQIIDLVPNQHPYIYEKQIVFALVRPIPRVLWEGKPTNPRFDLALTLDMDGVSLSSSVIGEFYLSSGWLGVLLGGLFYGKVAQMFSVLLSHEQERSSALVYSLAAMSLFAGMRSMLDLILMSYALLAWILVSRLILGKPFARRDRLTRLPIAPGGSGSNLVS